MNTTIENLTEPLRVDNPIQGDKIKHINNTNGLIVITTYSNSIVVPQEEIEDSARDWRNQELSETDYIVPLTDHPYHAVTLTYRVALRNWPSTSDFPTTRPTL